MWVLILSVLMTVSLSTQAQVDNSINEPASEMVSALSGLVGFRQEKMAELAVLQSSLTPTLEKTKREGIEESIEVLQDEILKTEEQLSILASGESSAAFDLQSGQKIDLKVEAEQLIQPFIIMLRSATDDARRIEKMRHTVMIANHHRDVASQAVVTVETLQNSDKLPPEVNEELKKIHEEWSDKLSQSENLLLTTQHQLDATVLAKSQESGSAGQAFTGFFKDRGLNLLLGLLALFGVMAFFRLIRSLLFKKRFVLKKRSFHQRLFGLAYSLGSIISAIAAMMYVFNMRNDWLLLGLFALLIIAGVWMLLKMLPGIVEQATLLLNLGAVQEGERVFFHGVPWSVTKLDFYSELENPALSGGSFTVPIRELLGLHSRPAATNEAWFPTRVDDWVKLDSGAIAKVIFQSPEFVQLVELGGARHTIAAPDFFASAPVNLSCDARVEIEFGISYKHQDIAATEVIENLRNYVRVGLGDLLSAEQLLNVEVELLACNASSIDYEVEADIRGDAAHLYEDVERALARLCLQACNKYGWEIPFPQLVVHTQ